MINALIESKVALMDANGDTFTFLDAERDTQNLRADEMTFPVVFMDPVKYKPTIQKSGHYENSYIGVMAFLYKSNLDDSPAQRRATQAKAMKAQRQLHILLENDSNNVKSIIVNECYPVFNMLDANLDGVIMPFIAELRNTDSVCE